MSTNISRSIFPFHFTVSNRLSLGSSKTLSKSSGSTNLVTSQIVSVLIIAGSNLASQKVCVHSLTIELIVLEQTILEINPESVLSCTSSIEFSGISKSLRIWPLLDRKLVTLSSPLWFLGWSFQFIKVWFYFCIIIPAKHL